MKNISKLMPSAGVAIFLLISSMAGNAMANALAVCSENQNISGNGFSCKGSATTQFSCVLKKGEPANQCYWDCSGGSSPVWTYNSDKSTGTGQNNEKGCNGAVGGKS